MIIIITGASHTGKTTLAQKLLEKYQYSYLSIDLLKMGLIRSHNTTLTPNDDHALETYLWPIVKEMIKTAIENHQNLIVEGCYIPLDWQKDFEKSYQKEIRFYCLVMSESYIKNHFDIIKEYANVIETRLDDSYCSKEFLIQENAHYLAMCKQYDCTYILINEEYQVEIKLEE